MPDNQYTPWFENFERHRQELGFFTAYKDGFEVIGDLANRRIPRIFWALKSFDEELISDELPDICTYERLRAMLLDPAEHINDMVQVVAMLQIDKLKYIEKDRLQTLELVRIVCEDALKDIPESQILLPPSKKKKLIEKIEEFYKEYDPFDFKHEGLGYGQTREDAFTPDGNLSYTKVSALPIFKDLHGITIRNDVPEEMKKKALDLIHEYRNYANDPIPDEITVYYMKPGEDFKYVKIKNALDGFEGIEYYIGKDLLFKEMGNGIVAISRKDAKINGLPKNRTVFTLDGRRLGVVRGPLMLIRFDEKGNADSLTTSDETEREWLLNNYAQAEHFDDKPVSNERAQQLLANTFITLSHDKYGMNTIKGAGFTDKEIKDFSEYLKNIGRLVGDWK